MYMYDCSHALDSLHCPDNSNEHVYILLEDRLEALFHSPAEYTVLDKMAGASLVGKKYKPLFSYFAHLKSEEPDRGAFRVLRWVVTCQSGTLSQ